MDPPHIARVTQNPFYVLGLEVGCSRAEFERASQTLLDMLEVGLADAQTYSTPFGPRPRTAELVRHATAELRDATRRILHELWANKHAGRPRPTPGPGRADEDGALPWAGGFRALGWREPS